MSALQASDRRKGLALTFVQVLAREDTALYEGSGGREGGAEILVEFALLALRWQPTRTLGVAAVVHDVTKRHHGESELSRSQLELEHEHLQLASDRERIGRDLDPAIQRLFAVGLALHAVASRVEPPEVARRISDAVDELDTAIAELRATTISLRHPPRQLAAAPPQPHR